MISVKDRAPLYPGRVDLSPVPGVPNRFDLARADSPTEPGTPINRRTMQLLQADIRTHPIAPGNTVEAGDVVDVVGGVVQGRRLVGSLPVGTVIKLVESGVAVDYTIVHQGRPSALYDTSCDGTWVVRKNIHSNRPWNGTNVTDYANSAIKTYLDSTFLPLFDVNTKDAIKQVKIPYRIGSSGTSIGSGASGLMCKVFLLSGYELGWTTSDNPNFPVDGARLSYFPAGVGAAADAKRIASLSGVPSPWWLRSPVTVANNTSVFSVGNTGDSPSPTATTSVGLRPAVILSPTFNADYYLPYSQAIALQSGTAGQSIDIIYDGVAELPGITAGTQITSAGVQGYAPQDGWLWVRPEWNPQPIIRGAYLGTGAPIDINLGFKPLFVVVYGGNDRWMTFAMDTTLPHPSGVAAKAYTDTDVSAIFFIDGGIRIGALSTLNMSGQQYFYVVFRG